MYKLGFTLTELLIVVVIIGVLALIAIPNYCDYTGRARVGEAMMGVDTLKFGISEAFINNGIAGIRSYATLDVKKFLHRRITNAAISTLPSTMGFITIKMGGISELQGEDVLVFSPHIKGERLSANNVPSKDPKGTKVAVKWVCAGKNGIMASTKFPSAGKGTVLDMYLPAQCR